MNQEELDHALEEMTPALLTELKRLEQKASPAPWLVEHCDYARSVCPLIDDVFIAAFRGKARALIEAAETMHAALREIDDKTASKAQFTRGALNLITTDALARVAGLFGEGWEK